MNLGVAKAAASVAANQAQTAVEQTQTQEEMTIDVDAISMLDVAGIAMDDIAEVRATTFPGGIFGWQNDDVETDTGESTDGKKQFKAIFKLQCLEVRGLTVANIEPTTVVGRMFQHRILKNIESENDVRTFLGQVKAFITDMGVQVPIGCDFTTMLELSKGARFIAPIRLKPNTKDKEADPFPELVTKKMQAAQ